MIPPSLTDRPTPADISRVAAQLYRGTPPTCRWLAVYRPYICPFHELGRFVPAGATVLDVGCGSGLLLSLLAATGRLRQGVGFDANPAMIRLAQQVASTHGLPLTFELRRVEQGLPEGRFDVISVIDVMHHVPPDAQSSFIDQLMQLVPPGGRLIYKDMCQRPLWRAAANRAHDLVLARQWIHYFPVEQVQEKAIAHGLLEAARINSTMWCYGYELRVYDRPAK